MRSIPVAEARSQLSRLVEKASRTHERFEISRSGSRAAVLLGADDYGAIMETLAILSDTKLVEALEQGIQELKNGEVYTAEQVKADMRKTAQDG
jgi:antitoxin YefM